VLVRVIYYVYRKGKGNMKNKRITKALSKGKKQGYYKIKARQMRLKSILENELKMLDFVL
jgi:hypothetical protein